VVLECSDLEAAERFYSDFGLVPSARTARALYLRARGSSHHVLALVRGTRGRLASVAMSVESELDLRKLASLPEATVERLDEPGGGQRVRLVAPGGLVLDAVHGIADLPALPTRAPVPRNTTGRVSRAGRAVRLPPAPSEILRIGHAALETPRPIALVLWLMRTFGMIVSDYQPLDETPGATPVASFMRCDRGSTPTDHHTLAIALGPNTGVAHIAFEVPDIDEIGRGAAHLRARKHRHAWGIGRHILGSQLFDYWRAPDGIVVEHYCDGDVFDAHAPTGRLPFAGSNLAQWGEPPPLDFALPPLSPAAVVEAARGLASSDEASVSLFARALRALSR
jgi:catechol 2,3-dioxygenase-like lactoylglutathione lyase family enzyme